VSQAIFDLADQQGSDRRPGEQGQVRRRAIAGRCLAQELGRTLSSQRASTVGVGSATPPTMLITSSTL
jgi:hypothetical protein